MEKMNNTYPLPNRAKVDFAMVCIGNDLRSSRIYDGDLVYFQKATLDDIREGNIVSVRYGNSARMARISFGEDCVYLGYDGFQHYVQYRDDDDFPLLGKAIAFVGLLYKDEEDEYNVEGEDE